MGKIETFSPQKAEPWLVKFVNCMLGQLTSNFTPLQESELQRLLEADSSALYIISVDGVPAGMLTLCHYYAPTGCKAWVEDVVVDAASRGMGLGRRLVEHALSEAQKLSPCTVMLTSRPSRIEANRLYQSVGFEARQTNVYRYKIKSVEF